MELAMQLQQYAEEVSQPLNDSKALSNHQQAKVQPKPPKPRKFHEREPESEPNAANNTTSAYDPEDDSEFIFDTYIRDAVNPSHPGFSACQMQGFEKGNVGVIVIEEAEEEIWETFGDCDDSGPELDSDEEDENGRYNASPGLVELAHVS